MANREYYRDGNLLVIKVEGVLTATEVVEDVQAQYPAGTQNVIWDLTQGTFDTIGKVGFSTIAKATHQALVGGSRKGGKTYFVGATMAEFGLLRMYSSMAEMSGVQIEYGVFKTLVEARIRLSLV